MKYRTENKFTGSYLYIKGDKEEDVEIKYETTGLISFAKAYEERNCSYEVIYALISELSKTGRLIEQEGKSLNGWVLDPYYIYIDPPRLGSMDGRFEEGFQNSQKVINTIKFFHYPFENEMNMEEGLRYLAEFVIEHAEYKDKDAVNIAYEFYLRIYRGNYVFDDLIS